MLCAWQSELVLTTSEHFKVSHIILLASRVESEYFWNDPNLGFLGFGVDLIDNSNEALERS
jgi:hypothetical protein